MPAANNHTEDRARPGEERKVSNAKWATVKHPYEDCPATAVVREGEDFSYGTAICFSGNGPDEARRIAACLNACDGMETDALERMPLPFSKLLVQDFQDVVAQRDELLAFAEEWLASQGNDANYMTAKARAAIAKAKGGAA